MGSDISRIIPQLYVGDIKSSKNKELMECKNITHIVSVMLEAKEVFPDKQYLCIPASDKPTENLSQYFTKCNDFIHSARIQNCNVLVHCAAGISRSATIVIAYIMSATQLTLEETLNLVKLARPPIDPNPGFRKQLQEFQTNGLAEERSRIREIYSDLMLESNDFEYCRMMLDQLSKN